MEIVKDRMKMDKHFAGKMHEALSIRKLIFFKWIKRKTARFLIALISEEIEAQAIKCGTITAGI